MSVSLWHVSLRLLLRCLVLQLVQLVQPPMLVLLLLLLLTHPVLVALSLFFLPF